MKKQLSILTLLSLSLFCTAAAQNVGIGVAVPTSKLDVNGALSLRPGSSIAPGGASTLSTNISTVYVTLSAGGGATTINAPASATEGQLLTILNLDDNTATFAGLTAIPAGGTGQFIYLNGAWRTAGINPATASGAWNTTGNSITGTEVLGTTNGQPLTVVSNNVERIQLASAGNVTVNRAANNFTGTNPVLQSNAAGDDESAVHGTHSATTGAVYGVVGEISSTTAAAVGVVGLANGTSGATDGIYGATASTTNTSAGVAGYANGTSGQTYGVYGQTMSSTNAAAGVIGVASATSGGTYGVYAQNASTSGYGVFSATTATSGSAIAVAGLTSGVSGSGVVGQASNTSSTAAGVTGNSFSASGFGMSGYNYSTNGTAVTGAGNNTGSASYLVSGSGGAFTGVATGVVATNTSLGVSQAIYTNNGGTICRVNYWNGATQFKIAGTGSVSTIVNGAEEGQRVIMFCPESPEVLFSDHGEGRLVNGRAHIDLDPIYAKNVTINEKHPMRVYIQIYDDENCKGVIVKNRTATGFDVVELLGGNSNASFGWQVVCNRADEVFPNGRISRNADIRFPEDEGPLPMQTYTPQGGTGINGGNLPAPPEQMQQNFRVHPGSTEHPRR